MKNNPLKIALAASILLSIAFAFSCSSDNNDDDDSGKKKKSSSSVKKQSSSSKSSSSAEVTLACTGLQKNVAKGGTIKMPDLICSNDLPATDDNWNGLPGGNWEVDPSTEAPSFVIKVSAYCGSVRLSAPCGTVTVITTGTSSSRTGISSSSGVTLTCTGLQTTVAKGGIINEPTLRCNNGKEPEEIAWNGLPQENDSWELDEEPDSSYTISVSAACGEVWKADVRCGTVRVTNPSSSSTKSSSSRAGSSSSRASSSSSVAGSSSSVAGSSSSRAGSSSSEVRTITCTFSKSTYTVGESVPAPTISCFNANGTPYTTSNPVIGNATFSASSGTVAPASLTAWTSTTGSTQYNSAGTSVIEVSNVKCGSTAGISNAPKAICTPSLTITAASSSSLVASSSSSLVSSSSSSLVSSSSSSLVSSSSSSLVSSSSSSLVSSSSSSVAAQTTDIYLLNLQPGSTTRELRFNWYSKTGTETKVRVFNNSDYLVAEASGETKTIKCVENTNYKCGPFGNNNDYITHKAAVTGLEPGTKYKYSVSNNGINWSAEYEYKTPPSGAFKFAATSDVQPDCKTTPCNAKTEWNNIVKQIANSNASLIVNSGDLANNGREDEYEVLFSPPKLQEIPFAPVMGNHDHNYLYDIVNFDHHFNLPNRVNPITISTSTKYHGNSNYYFLYNNVLFIGLNTSPQPSGSLTQAQDYVADFKATIEAAKNAYTLIQYDFIVVMHHRATNSISNGSGAHPLDGDIRNYVAAGFQQMMTTYGVDLVLAGHDHIYVRSQLMYNDRKSTEDNGENTGTLYLTLKPSGYPGTYQSGAAGISSTAYGSDYPYLSKVTTDTYKSCASNTDADYKAGTYLPESYACHSNYAQGKPGYTIVEVNGTIMNINVYEYDGRLFESYTLTPTLPKFN